VRKRHSYIEFYPSDWIAGTSRMPFTHRAVYFEVCLYNWDKVAAVPLDGLALILADVPDWQGIVETLIRVGKLRRARGGAVYNERAISAGRTAASKKSLAVKNGITGAEKRWGKRNEINGLDSHPNAEPEPEPEPDDSAYSLTGTGTGRECAPATGADPDPPNDDEPGEKYTTFFEAFWSVYPKKTGKLKASVSYQRAFERLGGKKGGQLRIHGKLLLAARIFADLSRNTDPRFIPHATTWLNGGRYDDEAIKARIASGEPLPKAARPAEFAPPVDDELTPPRRALS
jgi:hypothetical protein